MKKTSITIAGLILFVVLSAMQSNDQDMSTGRALHEENCARCHGPDGARRKWGAKDLRKSVMTDDLIMRQIDQGAGIMPSFRKKLNAVQIRQVAAHVKTLRAVR